MSVSSRRTCAALLPLFGAAVALLSLAWAPPLYLARCLIAVQPSGAAPAPDQPTPEVLWSARGREALGQSLASGAAEPAASSVPPAGGVPRVQPGSGPQVEAFLSRLKWKAVDDSPVFELRFYSHDPQLAAAGANTAAAVLERLLAPAPESEREARQRLQALEAEWRDLSAQPAADVALLEERRDAVRKALADVSEQYARARAARLDLEARWSVLRQPGQGDLSGAADAPQLQEMRDERTRLEQKREQMAVRFGPRWPEMKEIGAQIETLDARIVEQLGQLQADALREAESDYQQALGQEKALERSLRSQKQELGALEEREARHEARQARLGELERERAEIQDRLAAPPRGDAAAASVRVVSPAGVPSTRHGLPAALRLAAGVLAGLLLGLGGARLAERLDPTLSSAREAEGAIDAPFLAHLPEIPGGLPPGMLRLESAPAPGATGPIDPIAAAARGFRDLRTGLLLTRGGEPARVILVTSCRRADGKTFVAGHLALALARRGGRVLLIDAHLRRPRAHRLFAAAPGPGLVDVLAGTVQLEEAIRTTDEAGLFLMPAGDVNGGSAELLDAASLRHLRDRLLQPSRFQHLVIDAGEVGTAPAPERLAGACTGVVLVMRARRSTRATLRQAAAALRRHGASHLFGIWIGPAPETGVAPRAAEAEDAATSPPLSFGEPVAAEGGIASVQALETAEGGDPAPPAGASGAELAPLNPEVARRLERLRDRLGRTRGVR